MKILMYLNWSKNYILTTKPKALPGQNTKIAATKQLEVQRIATIKNELERIRMNPIRLPEHMRRSLWFSVEPQKCWTFKTFVALHEMQRLFLPRIRIRPGWSRYGDSVT